MDIAEKHANGACVHICADLTAPRELLQRSTAEVEIDLRLWPSAHSLGFGVRAVFVSSVAGLCSRRHIL